MERQRKADFTNTIKSFISKLKRIIQYSKLANLIRRKKDLSLKKKKCTHSHNESKERDIRKDWGKKFLI